MGRRGRRFGGERGTALDRDDLKVFIRLLCALGDLDQSVLAARAGLDPATLWRYGAGGLKPRESTLRRLTSAVGLEWEQVKEAILPQLRQWRLATGRAQAAEPQADAPSILDLAEQLGERVRTRVASELGGDLLGGHRPAPEAPHRRDREDAEFLASSLDGATPEEIDFLLRECPELHSWVLVEHLCHRSADPVLETQGVLEAARLASRIARLVPGPEPWRARVRGYAQAFHGRALWETGDPGAGDLALAAAERLWTEGSDPQGLLSEERFREAMAAASSLPHRLSPGDRGKRKSRS